MSLLLLFNQLGSSEPSRDGDTTAPTVARSDTATLFAVMLDRIAALEAAMAGVSSASTGIGHNNPPEPIEVFPLDDAANAEIVEAIRLLKEQVALPSRHPTEAIEAAKKLQTIGEKIGDYCKAKADVFASEAVKSAGAETGKWTIRLVPILLLGDKLMELAHAVLRWVASINFP